MKIINVESGFLTYQKIFKQLATNHSKLTVWQLLTSGERRVAQAYLESFHMESGKLNCLLEDPQSFESSLPLYFYLEEDQAIFKTRIHEAKGLVLGCAFPEEIKLLDEEEVDSVAAHLKGISTFWKSKRTDNSSDNLGSSHVRVKSMKERSSRDQEFLNQEFSPTLDEEDRLFADKRESPRARPQAEKWVKVRVNEDEKIHTLKLFDLSRGGMGFVTYDAADFPKGSAVHIVGFDQFDLDDPLVGTVVSHRQMDDSQIEFKIGIKFSEGQN